jgi:sporulation protein YlmC with PRC-barrel domain
MDLPASATVYAADGPCGRLTSIVLDPKKETVTHLVVAARDFPHTQHLVPVDLVLETSLRTVRLHCTCDDLGALPPFVETEYIEEKVPHYDGHVAAFLMEPLGVEVPTFMVVQHRMTPQGELVVDRGARVEATDGQVGHVDEVVVDPADGHMTHIVLRKGHLWGQRDVTIPVEEIAGFGENSIHLRLNKRQVGELPAFRP